MAGQEKKVRVTIPVSALERAGLTPDDQLQVKVHDDGLVLGKTDQDQPERLWNLIIWPLIIAAVSGLASYAYWWVRGLRPVGLTGSESVASLTIVAGVVTGAVLFIVFFLKTRNDPDNRFSRQIYWRNFPVITLAFVMILAFALVGAFWVLGLLFPKVVFDRLTAFLLVVVFTYFADAFMIGAALTINARTLSTILVVVIVSGCVVSMAANGQRRWWQHNLSFLGTASARNAWQFNLTLIFSALLMVVLVDYLFVSLSRIYPRTWRTSTLRLLLTLTAVDLGAVGLFPNNTNLHWLHDAVAGGLVTLLVLLIVGVRWLLPGVTKDFLWLSYGIGVALLLLNFGFRWFRFPSLTAFEIQAFAISFGWLLMLFARLQNLVNEGSAPIPVKMEKDG
ncbi:hypothetical protein D1831_09685 [Lactiplantibacillus garii]|uniref:DUF998 domain-containing protein n=1 Tax=Lactiplantibacillus garii TaxID=2306423 RepID=A0A426D6H8_9LACO|nr:AbrB/MazE/SpoVT family DNA-binding domain-containing protein [Lactiplantibacillus garii]RRK10019.1 hypothetical protein D1831_09685 [Lactiplantibacillus garii]